jgi:hypothetical protein
MRLERLHALEESRLKGLQRGLERPGVSAWRSAAVIHQRHVSGAAESS